MGPYLSVCVLVCVSVHPLSLQASDKVVRYVEFRFLSNHGNTEYTCVYRLRVHGRPASKQEANTEEQP